jgi:DNA-binding NarL/FixJ family response regulator
MFMIVIEGQEDDVVRQLREKLDMIENAKPVGYAMASSPKKNCTLEASTKFAKLPKLTARQQEILPLMLDGLSNKRIARVLGLSHFTVRNHITCLYAAFNVSGRRELSNILKMGQNGDLKAAA